MNIEKSYDNAVDKLIINSLEKAIDIKKANVKIARKSSYLYSFDIQVSLYFSIDRNKESFSGELFSTENRLVFHEQHAYSNAVEQHERQFREQPHLFVKIQNMINPFDYGNSFYHSCVLDTYDKEFCYIKACSDCHKKGVKTCSSCHGEKNHVCHYCNGHGYILERESYYSEEYKSDIIRNVEKTCHHCNRSGTVKCSSCYGKGEVTCPTCGGEKALTETTQLQAITHTRYSIVNKGKQYEYANKLIYHANIEKIKDFGELNYSHYSINESSQSASSFYNASAIICEYQVSIGEKLSQWHIVGDPPFISENNNALDEYLTEESTLLLAAAEKKESANKKQCKKILSNFFTIKINDNIFSNLNKCNNHTASVRKNVERLVSEEYIDNTKSALQNIIKFHFNPSISMGIMKSSIAVYLIATLTYCFMLYGVLLDYTGYIYRFFYTTSEGLSSLLTSTYFYLYSFGGFFLILFFLIFAYRRWKIYFQLVCINGPLLYRWSRKHGLIDARIIKPTLLSFVLMTFAFMFTPIEYVMPIVSYLYPKISVFFM